MCQISMKQAFVVFLLWVGMVVGPVQALGPVDGNDLLPSDLERIKIGSPAPDFTLEDEKGASVNLSQFRNKKNVVLVFYRGHW